MLSSMIENAAKQVPPVSAKIATCIVDTAVKNRTPYEVFNIDDNIMNQIMTSCTANSSIDPGPPSFTQRPGRSPPPYKKLILLMSVILIVLVLIVTFVYFKHNMSVQITMVIVGFLALLWAIYLIYKLPIT